MNSRANAAKALYLVCAENRTTDWLSANKPHLIDLPIEAEMVYGVLRNYFKLSTAVDNLLEKPLRQKDQILYYLLLVGAYQLGYMRVKEHAAINETVAACKTVGRPWAKGLVNAILRKLLAENTEQSFEQVVELPAWLHADLPTSCDLAALNSHPPMMLRINQKQISPDLYKQSLQENAIEFSESPIAECVTLKVPMPSESLPGWREGQVAVQDLGAQFAGYLASADNPARILDACAAPGGKLFHLLEHLPNAEVLALERSEARIEITQQLAERLGHTVDLRLADATDLDWWDGSPFDLILLDAPCSGTGTLRRHPEIKLHLHKSDIQAHTNTQLQLLQNLWPTLTPGGTLLYCTCSMLKAENDQVIEAFLSHLSAGDNDAKSPVDTFMKANDDSLLSDQVQVETLELPMGEATQFGWQLTPPETDGFYYAKLKRIQSASETVG